MNKIWLIGAGGMALDYIKVLSGLKREFLVIGRGEKSASNCREQTGATVKPGGLTNFLSSQPEKCSHAIVAVGVESLFKTTLELLNYGIQNILVEKPAGLSNADFKILTEKSKEKEANIYVAYNRRFYSSVVKALEIIKKDKGVTSFNFEFTEWAHKIEPLQKADGVKEKWFLANSTHVVDLAFYLGGEPKKINCFTAGSLNWHPSASIFSGAGISNKGATFSYQANWESAGRWSVEILTKENRLIFRPMEKLQIQKRGSIAIEEVEVDYTLDTEYKPGLFLQTKNFLENNTKEFCSIEDQSNIIDIYNQIANY